MYFCLFVFIGFLGVGVDEGVIFGGGDSGRCGGASGCHSVVQIIAANWPVFLVSSILLRSFSHTSIPPQALSQLPLMTICT